jgi:hypothetical protein
MEARNRWNMRMRALMQRLKRLWHTPVEFYGVDRPEPQAGPWHGLILFVILLVILSLLWLVRYLPERTYLVEHRTLANISASLCERECIPLERTAASSGVLRSMDVVAAQPESFGSPGRFLLRRDSP